MAEISVYMCKDHGQQRSEKRTVKLFNSQNQMKYKQDIEAEELRWLCTETGDD